MEILPIAGRHQQDVEKNKDLAAFSYVWVMSVFIFIMKKDSPFIRFHAQQAMVLFALSVVVWFIPVVGQLLELLVLAGMVLGFLSAAQGQWRDVPLIGPLSRRELGFRGALREATAQAVKLLHAIRDLFRRKKSAAAGPGGAGEASQGTGLGGTNDPHYSSSNLGPGSGPNPSAHP
jgi:uncharacterized membrane protein